MAKKSDVFDRLAVSAGEAQPGHSLYRWFIFHHDRFSGIIARADRPSWETIAAELAADGLTKVDGRPLDSGYVRQAWVKAQVVVKKMKSEPSATKPGPVASTERPDWPVRPFTQPKYLGTTEMPLGPTPSRYTFTGASLKTHKDGAQ